MKLKQHKNRASVNDFSVLQEILKIPLKMIDPQFFLVLNKSKNCLMLPIPNVGMDKSVLGGRGAGSTELVFLKE